MGGRAAALILAGWFAAGIAAAAPPVTPAGVGVTDRVDPTLAELRIVGERPGPALWRVRDGGHVLWLLGTLNHVPRHLQWHSVQVEQALAQSQELLPAGTAVATALGPFGYLRLYFQWRRAQRLPAHGRLQDELPAELYGRFERLRHRFAPNDDALESMRPPFAAWHLYRRAIAAAGLSENDDIESTVLALARRRGLKIAPATIGIEDPARTLEQISSLPPRTEVQCLQTTVSRLETDLPIMQRRALAWAVGDVAALRALPFPDQHARCLAALAQAPRVRALVDQARWTWLNAAEAALRRNSVTFATAPIYELLADDGPLARFRADGFTVEGP